MTTVQAPKKRRSSPLLYPAVFLSLASLAWTTWSLVDLLGTGLIGVTVAAGADIIWGSVIIAEARGLRITIGRSQRNIVPAFGWVTLAIVAVFLAWHGIATGSYAMAAAGPFLPFGAKAVWVLALADMRDPAALTHEELHTLAAMERGMVFEERQHGIRMRQQTMAAELLMSEVSVDFDIELMRQQRTRELSRRRPLELPAAVGSDANTPRANDTNTEGEPFASLASDSPLTDHANGTANDANTAGQPHTSGTVFGFGAALPNTNQIRPHTANSSPRKANANDTRTPDANDTRTPDANDSARTNTDPREAAAADYRNSVRSGAPISGAELGRRYGRTARWGQKVIAELKTA
jgi:hypothetical protein